MSYQTETRRAGQRPGFPKKLSSFDGDDNPNIAPTAAPAQARREIAARLRRRQLIEHLYLLGPSPLGHFLREVENGASISDHLERYAKIDPAFVRALGGDRYAPVLWSVNE